MSLGMRLSLKYFLLMFLLLSTTAGADEICGNYESNIEPDFLWKESDFNKNTSSKALAELSSAIEKGTTLNSLQLANILVLVQGYILKQNALRVLSGKDLDKMLIEYHVAGFCEFLGSPPISDLAHHKSIQSA